MKQDRVQDEAIQILNELYARAKSGNLELAELIGTANQLSQAGLRNHAIALYTEWIAHTESPLLHIACFNQGVEFSALKEFSKAEEMYRKSLSLEPDFVQARLNLGNCLEQQGYDDDALNEWRSVLRWDSINLPENKVFKLHALNNLGRLLEIKRNYNDALSMLEQSIAAENTQKDVLLHLVHLRQKICQWPIYKPLKNLSKTEMIDGTSPLAMLAATDDPKLQLRAAQNFVAHKYKVTNQVLAPSNGYKHNKIRIGYLSSDLCMHAVSLLTVELFELHDRRKFEVYGFCWSREDGTAHRQRVIAAMDHFIRIGSLSDKEAAELIRASEIDILVDLQGLTSGARPLILSYRPAPMQVTYLGFPGTTGLPWIDYVIADKYLIPEKLLNFHSEKALYMPDCYQVSDSKRPVGQMPKRADYDLPEHGFVFCSFNNNYKYTPEMFSTWMRILKRTPNSVLWLLADNEWAHANLVMEAKKLGIEQERLIFAPRVAPPDYLARYQLADLFLDTYPFNGGTTANDALFMGLPILTLSGRVFASRMAGSLLTNLGITELIAKTLKEYEQKAIRFAQFPNELKELRQKLQQNKRTHNLFNTENFVKQYENVLSNKLKCIMYADSENYNAVNGSSAIENDDNDCNFIRQNRKFEDSRPDNLINKVRYSKILEKRKELLINKYSILEVGACESGIASYLKRPVTGLNLVDVEATNKWLNTTTCNMIDIDYSSNSFDYVLSVDVLQHLSREERIKAIAEMLRVAKREVIIVCPCGKMATRYDIHLHNNYIKSNRSIPKWLRDQVQRGLPEVGELLSDVRQFGYKFEIYSNESLMQHYASIMLDDNFREIDELYNMHNLKCRSHAPIGESTWDMYYNFMIIISKNHIIRSQKHEYMASSTSAVALSQNSFEIYSCFHKRFDTSHLLGITPVYSGSAAYTATDGELTDILSDSTSLNNNRWSELSAIYKIWKEGERSDVIGFCHYRRLFNFGKNGVLENIKVAYSELPDDFTLNISNKDMSKKLAGNESIVVAKPVQLNENIFSQYCYYHNTNDLLWVINKIVDKHQHLVDCVLEQLLDSSLTAYNMFVMSWEHFDELCTLWFDILLDFEKSYPLLRSNDYQNRDVGFLAERILDVWIRYKKSQKINIVETPIYFVEY